jgi:hypothetical protein
LKLKSKTQSAMKPTARQPPQPALNQSLKIEGAKKMPWPNPKSTPKVKRKPTPKKSLCRRRRAGIQAQGSSAGQAGAAAEDSGQAGVASRRKAEEMIEQGRVQVNGKTVTELGTKADAGRDHIRVDGKLLQGANGCATLC